MYGKKIILIILIQVTTDKGAVYYVDSRNPQTEVIKVSEEAVTGI